MDPKVKYTFPRAAWPVLRVLRRDLPRPKTLPKVTAKDVEEDGGGFLRWPGGFCPMGLHHGAPRREPVTGLGFGSLASDDAVMRTGARWDTFVDPQAAVDAVWPRKGR